MHASQIFTVIHRDALCQRVFCSFTEFFSELGVVSHIFTQFAVMLNVTELRPNLTLGPNSFIGFSFLVFHNRHLTVEQEKSVENGLGSKKNCTDRDVGK